MSNIIREMQTIRNNQKEILEIKQWQKLKNTFNTLMCRLNVVKERIGEIENWSIEIIHMEMPGEKNRKANT